jgi:hypothetical protein
LIYSIWTEKETARQVKEGRKERKKEKGQKRNTGNTKVQRGGNIYYCL